jgi:hypothetical protein
MKKIFLLIFVLLVVSDCATQRIYTTEDQSARIPTHEGTSHFFLYGIAQTREYSAEQICQDRTVLAVETQYSFVNGLLTVITYGLYYPMSYTVYCGKKPKKEVTE